MTPFLFLVTAVGAYSFWKFFLLASDISRIREHLQALIQGRAPERRLSLRSSIAQQLHCQISGTLASIRGQHQDATDIGSVLNLSNSIIQKANRLSSVAEEACSILISETSPDVLAVAVLLLDNENRPYIAASRGIPRSRAHETLLCMFEQEADKERTSDYRVPRSRHLETRQWSAYDFSAFEIESSCFVAIRNGEELAGTIWLGLRRRESTLPRERRLFIEALAEHFAASFAVAKQFEGTIAEHNREKRWFLGISHDLRAPGNTALFALRALLDEASDVLSLEQRQTLTTVRHCLEDQLETLGDVLDLAKHRQGVLVPQSKRFRLEDELGATLAFHRNEAETKGLRFECDPWPTKWYFADPKQMRRVFSNLLSNAVKYTEHGTIRTCFRVFLDSVQISVTDTGQGIPPEERHLLFGEFSRLPGTSAQPGIGLGLNIAKLLCEVNGGTLNYSPGSGGGSMFTFSLPRASDESESNVPVYKSALVLDDDEAAGKAHVRMLAGISQRVTRVTNCRDAVEAVRELDPEVVITDLNLEGETCEEFLNFMKSLRTPVKIVLATGLGDPTALAQLRRRYSVHILEKPFDRTAFRAALFESNVPEGLPSAHRAT